MIMKTLFIHSALMTISLILIAFIFSSCIKKELFDPSLQQEQFDLKSNANGATYNIRVGLPSGFDPASKKYATLYVLDGENDFEFVSNRCNEISSSMGVTNVVVVSIGYGKNRSIDYTPTKVSSVTGGGPDFFNFIETQLITKMQNDYHVDTTRSGRVIIGHSYGGLFGTYALLAHNHVFGNYLLLSPSLWYDHKVCLKMEKESESINKNQKQIIYMAIGGAEEADLMLNPFNEFYNVIQSNYINSKLSKNIEPNKSHMGSKNPNITKSLNYYFQNRL